MQLPAARLLDLHACPVHGGGIIAPLGCYNVLINMRPAVCMGDSALCLGLPINAVVRGCPKVLIGNRPAARLGDNTAHGGIIASGSFRVLIGPEVPSLSDIVDAAKSAAKSAVKSAKSAVKSAVDYLNPEAELNLSGDGSPLKIGVEVTLYDDELLKKEFLDGAGELRLGTFDVKATASKGEVMVGAESSLLDMEISGRTAGDENLGLTAGTQVKLVSAEAYAGYTDGTLGANVGFSFASVEARGGVNILGFNIGLKVGASAGLEAGFAVGKETAVKLGPLSFGLTFGRAK